MQHAALRVRQRLSQVVKRTTGRIGLGVTGPVQQMLDQMLQKGVVRMQNQQALEREEQIRLAEDNIKRYLDELGMQAAALGTFPMADQEAFDKALKKACPIWPYC